MAVGEAKIQTIYRLVWTAVGRQAPDCSQLSGTPAAVLPAPAGAE